jgi:hypothetical protein
VDPLIPTPVPSDPGRGPGTDAPRRPSIHQVSTYARQANTRTSARPDASMLGPSLYSVARGPRQKRTPRASSRNCTDKGRCERSEHRQQGGGVVRRSRGARSCPGCPMPVWSPPLPKGSPFRSGRPVDSVNPQAEMFPGVDCVALGEVGQALTVPRRQTHQRANVRRTGANDEDRFARRVDSPGIVSG